MDESIIANNFGIIENAASRIIKSSDCRIMRKENVILTSNISCTNILYIIAFVVKFPNTGARI